MPSKSRSESPTAMSWVCVKSIIIIIVTNSYVMGMSPTGVNIPETVRRFRTGVQEGSISPNKPQQVTIVFLRRRQAGQLSSNSLCLPLLIFLRKMSDYSGSYARENSSYKSSGAQQNGHHDDKPASPQPAHNLSAVVRKQLMGYVGFANLPNQVHRKSIRKGFEFTVMVVGVSHFSYIWRESPFFSHVILFPKANPV